MWTAKLCVQKDHLQCYTHVVNKVNSSLWLFDAPRCGSSCMWRNISVCGATCTVCGATCTICDATYLYVAATYAVCSAQHMLHVMQHRLYVL